MTRGRGSRAANVAPLTSLALAALIAALLLPSFLRPPPEQSNQSAALSPDAPPEDQAETIVQSLRQAASRTAGATGGDEVAATTTTSTVERASRGQCYGDPPRQTDSVYSPPCRAAFTGDNGGATYKNVTGDVVRVGYWNGAFGMPRSSERGDIADVPPPGESEAHRTARIIQRYFNDRYELYGRRLQLVALPGEPATAEEHVAQAIAADQEHRIFAAVHLESPFCHELTRRGLVCFGGNGYQDNVYLERAPLWWSYQMGIDNVDRMSAEYICKKLAGRNADFAGGLEKGRPRRIAVVAEGYYGNDFRTYDVITNTAKELCGFEPAFKTNFDGTDSAQTANLLAQLRANDITTVIGSWGLVEAITLYSAADANQYFPEWVLLNSYGLDFNDPARLLPPTQVVHQFGMSGWELPRPFQDWDCYRAYKSIDPSSEPDQDVCRLIWISLEHILNGIQEAGPELTPDSFAQGMRSMPLQEAREPWAIAGGYTSRDYSFVDDLVEIWWDPEAVDPDGGELGAYRHTGNGRRWRFGEMDDVVRVFSEGVTGYVNGRPI